MTPLLDQLAAIGGLTEFIFTGFWLLYVFFGHPFRELKLAISYSQLVDNLQGKTSLTDKLINKIDCCFYFKAFLNKRLPNKFRNLIEQSYIGVSIDLSLKDLSAKKITIVGAVNNPGTYLVNPFTTISNSLAYSGGIQSVGSLRNIRLLRSNGDIFSFDLYELLIEGDRTNDITIQSANTFIIDSDYENVIDSNGTLIAMYSVQ